MMHHRHRAVRRATLVEMLEPRTLLSALPATTNISLDGTWQIQHNSTADIAGLSTTWSSTTVPTLLTRQAEAYAWYRRTINVPTNWSDGHVFVDFQAVRYVSDVYVNGVRVGGHLGGWETFDIDITPYCTFGGSDVLTVRVQDIRGVFTDPTIPYDSAYDPNNVSAANGDNVLAPVGSQPTLYGIWQDVNLLYHRNVYIDNVAIVTSVRNHQISATYTLDNIGANSRQVTISSQVLDGSTSVLGMGSSTVTVPAGGTLTVTLTQPWTNPQLWMPGSPHLYYLSSNLNETAGALDTNSTRFGFREFWTSGTQFYLNGTPMTFLATAGHPMWDGTLMTDDQVRAALQGVMGAGCVAMRLHANIWPANWYKVADEIGLPLVLESAVWCDSNAYALDNAAFWQNFKDHWANVIATHRDHPSVMIYSVENEIMLCGGARVSTTMQNLESVGQYIKSLDPTRPIMFEGDEDPGGTADIINLHYPHEFPTYVDYPNTANWLNSATVLDTYPNSLWQWNRTKPLYIGEFLWMFQQTPAGYTGILGDSAYEDDANRRAKGAIWQFQIQAYREAGVAGIDPWTLWESGAYPNPMYDAIVSTYQPNEAFVDEYDTRFFSSQQVTRTVHLFNNTLSAANLTLQWWLNGQLAGQTTYAMQPNDQVQRTITLSMPAVSSETDVNFALVVLNGSTTLYSNTRVYQVFPTTTGQLNIPAGTRIAVFQGDGTAVSFLQSNGITPLIMSDLSTVLSVHPDLLIIDAHALDSYALGTPAVGGGVAANLTSYMRGGGTVLVLEQNSIPTGLLPVQLESAPTTIGFLREPGSPVLTGLTDADFQYWRGDNYVAKYPIVKPGTGGFRVLADAGDSGGLDRVLMMELLEGKGRCILSQVLISQKLGQEPMAKLLFSRLISYGVTVPTQRSVVGVIDADGSIVSDMAILGVQYTDLTGQLATADLSAYTLLVLDATSPEVLSQSAKLSAFAKSGGTVMLHGVTASVLSSLGSALPGNLTVVSSTSVPALMGSTSSAVSSGMMNENLYWVAGQPKNWNDTYPLDPSVLTGSITRQPPSLAQSTVIECENMSPPASGTGMVSNGTVELWTNGSIQTTITLPSTGNYFFGVVGYGTPTAGVYPNVAIYLDDVWVGAVSVNAANTSYSTVGQATAGTHTLRLMFTNDAWDPANNEDRNVWLDKFFYAPAAAGPEQTLMQPAGLVNVVDGAGQWVLDDVNWDGRMTSTLPARYLISLLDNLGARFTADSTLTVPASVLTTSSGGAWQLGSDGVLGIWSNNNFTTNVSFGTTGTYKITLEVRASVALNVYGAPQTLLDGAVINTAMLTDANWALVTVQVPVTAGIHSVGVGFQNDYYDATAGQDRNIWIRSIRVKLIDTSAPTISSATVNAGATQRSMVTKATLIFSEPIAFGSGGLTIVRRDGSAVPNVIVSAANPSGDLKTWELTFSGTGVAGGSLPDGAYKVLARSSAVADLSGNALAADFRYKFYRLFGDTNADRQVTRSELQAIRALIGQSATSTPWFDYDGDGLITSGDYRQLRLRMARTLLR